MKADNCQRSPTIQRASIASSKASRTASDRTARRSRRPSTFLKSSIRLLRGHQSPPVENLCLNFESSWTLREVLRLGASSTVTAASINPAPQDGESSVRRDEESQRSRHNSESDRWLTERGANGVLELPHRSRPMNGETACTSTAAVDHQIRRRISVKLSVAVSAGTSKPATQGRPKTVLGIAVKMGGDWVSLGWLRHRRSGGRLWLVCSSSRRGRRLGLSCPRFPALARVVGYPAVGSSFPSSGSPPSSAAAGRGSPLLTGSHSAVFPSPVDRHFLLTSSGL